MARIKAYGLRSSMALGWNTESSQQVRFEVLADIADLSNHSVLDVGCGRGDLRVHLGLRYPGIDYTGIDQLEPFIILAKKQYGHIPRTKFVQANIWECQLPPADFVFASGTLNYRHANPLFIFEMIAKLFSVSKKGLGFNLLSKVGHPPGELNAYQPYRIMEYTRTLTSKVSMREDYQAGDYTIFMYK